MISQNRTRDEVRTGREVNSEEDERGSKEQDENGINKRDEKESKEQDEK